MTDRKPWYLSRTIWASMVSVALALGSALGVSTDSIDPGSLAEQLVQLASAAAAGIAILGRLRATARIG